MDHLTALELLDFLTMLADRMPAHKDKLRELDAQMGDGDLGVTVVLGMKGIKDGLADLTGEDVGTVIARSGANFNRAAASTFGAIFATGMMQAGQQVRGQQQIVVADLARMFGAAAEGIRQRGGAELGDKTVLDVIVPMGEQLKDAADRGADLREAVQEAHERCQEALEETKNMAGKHGRAGWFGEKSVGMADPGAAAICLMTGCFCEFVQGLATR